MEVTRIEDKNGAATIVVSGYTTVAPNTPIEVRVGERVFDGGLVDGQYHYHRTIADIPFTTIEVWTAQKLDAVLVDSWSEEPAEEAVEEPVKKKIARKKVA